MKPQLIIDCGGRVLSALLVTADGELVPWSQDIRNVATRHVSADVLFDPHAAEHPDFSWEESLETLSRATSANFFQRARRIGLRRPWDAQSSAEALRLTSPLAVLSSAGALADRVAGKALPHAATAMFGALLDPMFAFLADRQLAAAGVEIVLILAAHTGRKSRSLLRHLLRRRGFRHPTIVRREIAAAMALAPGTECVVVDASDDDLHLHRVSLEGDDAEKRFRTVSATTVRGFGWSRWVSSIAAALGVPPSSEFDRTMAALLTGSPESLEPQVTRAGLLAALDDSWVHARRSELGQILPISTQVIFTGGIFVLDAARRVFDDTGTWSAPVLDHSVRAVASALLWLRAGPERRLVLSAGGTLRVNSFHGDAIALVPQTQLPAPGEACHVEANFRFAGEAGKSFLLHLLWGADGAPEGNATLCAVPLQLRRDCGEELRLSVHLRRSRSGSRLSGRVEARMPSDVVAARARFAEELEVRR
jgi:hypothetical protein